MQTPALANIKASYVQTSRQETQDLIESLAYHHQSEDKENNRNVDCAFRSKETYTEEKTALIKSDEPLQAKNVTTGCASTCMKALTKTKLEEEVVETPTPLESTTIMGKHEIGLAGLKSRRRWRNISDITSPSLNMSPIPLSAENENGIIVDSYFQPNETGAVAKPENLAVDERNRDVKSSVQMKCQTSRNVNLKETFVMPHLPFDITNMKKKLNVTEDRMTVKSENGVPGSLEARPCQQITNANETRIIRQHDGALSSSRSERNSVMGLEKEAANSSIHSSEHSHPRDVIHGEMEQISDRPLSKDQEKTRAIQVSPRTMLDESLTLISQMKLPMRSTNTSPKDNNTSINSSLISQGQFVVSPNSFMENMRTMMRKDTNWDSNEHKNTSSPDIPSPSSVLNNSVPHSIMVSHLQSIRRSLQETPVKSSDRTKKPQRVRTVPKRRSITSQFHKEEGRKVAAAVKAVKTDRELLVRSISNLAKKGHVSKEEKLMAKKCNLLLHSQAEISHQKKSPSFYRKTQRVAIKRSPLGKKSPRGKKSPVKISPRGTVQKHAMKRIKNKVNKNSGKNSNPIGFCDKALVSSTTSVYTDRVEGDLSKSNNYAVSAGSDSDDLITPLKKHRSCSSDSSAAVKSLDSATVVKSRSQENSGRFFDDLSAAEFGHSKEPSERSSSAMRKEKLFPDIHVLNGNIDSREKDIERLVDASEMTYINHCADATKPEEQELKIKDCDCAETFIHECDVEGGFPKKIQLHRVATAAERSMSPRSFGLIPLNNLPTSPGVSLEPSRRGTMTVTKSRPSDALLTAMSNRKSLFQDSPKKTHCITEDDTETLENIRVRVEEHYQEIDGEMYVIVKERTDVSKSVTETYIEQLTVSPNQFQTPTRLPNSPDVLVSRRSTHVVRSPKIINAAALNRMRTDFSKKLEGGLGEGGCLTHVYDAVIEEKEEDAPESCLLESSDPKQSTIKSDTFEKEPTVLATPSRNDLPTERSEPPITSVCSLSLKLVDYDVVSESDSARDVTKDSLDTSQSLDSVNSLAEEADMTKEGHKHGEDFDVELGLTQEKQFVRENPDQNLLTKVDQDDVEDHSVKNDGRNSVMCAAATVGDESEEDEQFYDTLSERYYDTLSDTSPDKQVLEEAAQLDKPLREHVSNTERYAKAAGLNEGQEVYERSTTAGEDACPNFISKDGYPSSVKGITTTLTEEKLLMSMDMREEAIFVEMGIDRKEMFEVTETEIINLTSITGLKPVDEILRSTPEAKMKRKMRRSISASTLLENQLTSADSDVQNQLKMVSFGVMPSPVPKSGFAIKPLTQSKSAIQILTQRSPAKITEAKFPSSQRTAGGVKQRSQSMSNLSRLSEKKAAHKYAPFAADSREAVKRGEEMHILS